MKNDKDVKQVSRLTGALLARKGTASPSPDTLPIIGHQNKKLQNEKQFLHIKELKGSSVAGPVAIVKGNISSRQSTSAKSSDRNAGHKRIAMTLRMEEESHLQLRLYSAHTRKSCQVILSEALDLYFAQNNDKVPLQEMASQKK